MIVPAAMNIYSAEAMLKNHDSNFLMDEIKELRSSGAARRIQGPGMTSGFEEGYLLGLETGRAILAGSAALVVAGVKANEVL